MTSAIPPDKYFTHNETLDGVPVEVASYRVCARFSARVMTIDPRTTIGRGQGDTRREAERAALESASFTLKLRGATDAMRQCTEQITGRRGAK